MNIRKFFTTLLAITRLLDFWVHYPTLPYPKLKNHYLSGPAGGPLDFYWSIMQTNIRMNLGIMI